MDKFTIKQIQTKIESINLSIVSLHEVVKHFILQMCKENGKENVIDIKTLGYKYEAYINGCNIFYSVGYIAVNQKGDIYLMDFHKHNRIFLYELPIYEQAKLLDKLTLISSKNLEITEDCLIFVM